MTMTDTLRERLALDRSLSSFKTAQIFVDRGLRQLPEDKALKLAAMDALDVLATAIDAVEERAK